MSHNLFLDISLLWTVFAFFILLLSWRLACLGNQRRHRQFMLFLTIAAWIFIAIYLCQSQRSHPLVAIKEEYILWLIFHGVLGLIALLGATLLVVARLWQEKRAMTEILLIRHLNQQHKNYGRIFICLWLFTHIGGVINYVLFI